MNTVTVIGRLGRDAEIKDYESGRSRTTFSLAVNRWDSRTSSEVTDWFNAELWDITNDLSSSGKKSRARIAFDNLKKGRLVVIEGRIRSNSWIDKTGITKQSYIITVSNYRLLGSKKESE
jgi:single-strand DNA-binding protein